MAASPRLKVLLINHSDTAGGASVVSMRLLRALGSAGCDARMLVVHKNGNSLRVEQAVGDVRSRILFVAEHADIYLHNGHNRDTLFKISTAKYGLPLHRHPWVREADVIVLNWLNQGMLSLEGIRKIAALRKPIVWTMHDQWNMTGVCHYTAGCDRWLEGCGCCPLLGSNNPKDLSAKTFERKRKLYTDVPIRFVAVSNRLAELCARSPLMADADITVIPNAFPVDEFKPGVTVDRRSLGLPYNGRLIIMGAARLDDPVKNLPLAVEALNRVATPSVAAVFFGEIRNPDILKRLKIPYVHIGTISDHRRLRDIMAHANVVLSTSVWETWGATLVEGIACGAVAVATDNGGQADIITEGETGYLSAAEPDALATAIDKALALPNDRAAREQRHHAMAVKFADTAVAAAYRRLFDTLLTV